MMMMMIANGLQCKAQSSTIFISKSSKFPQSNWHYCYYFVLLNRLSFGCGSVEYKRICSVHGMLFTSELFGSGMKGNLCITKRVAGQIGAIELSLESRLLAFVLPGRNFFRMRHALGSGWMLYNGIPRDFPKVFHSFTLLTLIKRLLISS